MILRNVLAFRSILSLAIIGTLGAISGRPAHAFITGDEYQIGQFCDYPSLRRTVIYIDSELMVDGQVGWAEQLHGKLTANLTPAEEVTLVELDTKAGRSEELWTACYPDYTPEQRRQIEADGPYLLSENPLDVLERQQQFFKSQLVAAMEKIYVGAKRPEAAVRFTESQQPRRAILRAIASDEARYSKRDRVTRVIAYTDGLEHSELFDVFGSTDEAEAAKAVSNKLGLNFGKAIFYFYGVGSTLKSSGDSINRANSFWDYLLVRTNGHLASFGADLAVSTSRPVLRRDFRFTVDTGGRRQVGTMVLMTDDDGVLQDSFISLSNVRSAILNGTFKCQGSESCTLNAKIMREFATDSDQEEILLSGAPSKLEGAISVANAVLVDGSPRVEAPVIAQPASN